MYDFNELYIQMISKAKLKSESPESFLITHQVIEAQRGGLINLKVPFKDAINRSTLVLSCKKKDLIRDLNKKRSFAMIPIYQ